MVRFFRFLLLVFLGISVLLPTAHGTVQAAPLQQNRNADLIETTVRLDELNIRETALTGPFDARFFSVNLPADWQLQSGASLQLDMETLLTSPTITDTVSFYGGSLEVQFNNIVIGRIFLNRSGSQVITIPISDTALVSTRLDGSHSLNFILDAGINCGNDYQTTVLIRAATSLFLPHTLEPIVPDLKMLPRPIIQNSPLQKTSAVIVVPDKPTAAELQAAFTVAAKAGSLTSSRFMVPLFAEGVITPTVRNNTSLIYVGKADSFTDLAEVEFSQTDVDAQAGDGIVQMAVSTWNERYGVLLISGADDAGVVKAAQAFSTGTIRSTLDPSTAVIVDVRSPYVLTDTIGLQVSNVPSTGLTLRQTLFDLGYKNQVETGIGGHTFDFFIDMPAGFETTDAASFDVLFTHSALLDYSVSALQIKINDQPLSSIQLSDETAERGATSITFPRGTLNVGRNKISIISNLSARTPCVDPNLAGIWLKIRGESVLNLALRPTQTRSVVVRSLATFQEPLTISPTLKNLAFVVNDNDPDSWTNAGRLAFDLGDRLDPSFIELSTVFPSGIDGVKAEHDLVVVGQPSTLPIIQDLNPTLPAPFAAGSDHPTFGNSRVIYRIKPETPLGYLSLSASPWNPIRSVLLVAGNTTASKQWAVNALVTDRLRSRLNGTIAVINGEQTTVEDPSSATTTGDLLANVPQNQTTVEARPVPVQPRATWILFAIAFIALLMGLILGYMGLRIMRQRRERRAL